MIDPGVSFTPTADDGEDEYRCFVIDPGLTADQFIEAYQVRPGNPDIVHHVILFAMADAEADADAAAREAIDADPGYACFGGPGPAGSQFVVGWAPGNAAVPFPAGTGVRLHAGRTLVMQVHYNLAHGSGDDRTTIDLDLADQVEREAQVLSVARPSGLDLAPGQPDVTATASTTIPVDGEIWGAAIHMHTRGIAADVQVRGGDDACLIDLDQWSFHWQHLYWYAAPVRVEAGDTIELTCHYDTREESAPVGWGEGTDDEMCIGYFYSTR